MTAHVFVTRRMLLRDMGRSGLAVLVFGTAACSDDTTDNATPTPEPGSTTSSPRTDPGSTQPEPTTSGSSTSQPAGRGHSWHRVNLGFVSAYILYRNGEAALVDTGVAGSEGDIEAVLGEVGLGWSDVGHLIVTHKHPDHQGSVGAVIEASQAPWYAGGGDIAQISAPTEGTVVENGDNVFDLQIIETPGHTPGHISVLDGAAGLLVAGDALNGADGGVAGPNPDFSEDMDTANASAQMLASFDYETVLFGHGEPVLEGASGLVADLAESLNGG